MAERHHARTSTRTLTLVTTTPHPTRTLVTPAHPLIAHNHIHQPLTTAPDPLILNLEMQLPDHRIRAHRLDQPRPLPAGSPRTQQPQRLEMDLQNAHVLLPHMVTSEVLAHVRQGVHFVFGQRVLVVGRAEGEEDGWQDGGGGLEEVGDVGVEEGGVFEEGGGAEAAGRGGGGGVGEKGREGVERGVGRWGCEVGYECRVLGCWLVVCGFVYIH